MSGLVDLGENILKIKDELLGIRDAEPLNKTEQFSRIFKYIQSRNSLYYAWLKCLWENYYIAKDEERFLFICDDEFSKAHSVGIARRESSLLDMQMTCLNIYKNCDHQCPALEIKRIGKKRRYLLSETKEKRAFSAISMRVIVSESYYEELFSRKFRWNNQDISINLIFDVWEQIYRVIEKETATFPKVDDKRSITSYDYCRLMPKSELKKFLFITCKPPSFSSEILDSIIDFLTFDKGKSVWNAPLIPLKDKGVDKYSFFITAILHADTLKTVEGWLRQSKMQVSQKGFGYEAYLRERLEVALNKNPLLTNKKIFHLNKKHIGEEIDVIFVIDKFLFIGEAKCFVTPTSSVEIFNFKEKVHEAVKQIKRKENVVKKNIQKIANTLNLAIDSSYTIIPFFISNVIFYSGIIIDGVVLTDFNILFYYLKGSIKKRVKNGDDTNCIFENTIKFYDTETEAGEQFIAVLSDPLEKKMYTCEKKITAVLPALTSNDYDIYEVENIAKLHDIDFERAVADMGK